jgi:hypothetical protein
MTRILAIAAAMALLGIAGCVHVPERFSMLDCSGASSTLTLYAPTGSWGVGGHSLSIYRETGTISITLPSAPGAIRQRYDAKELVVSDTSPFPAKPVAVTAGYVEINTGEHRAVVAVTTPDGEFWANGSYPLR